METVNGMENMDFYLCVCECVNPNNNDDHADDDVVGLNDLYLKLIEISAMLFFYIGSVVTC